MPFVFTTFMDKVRAADHGVFQSFTLSKSALKDLIGVLEGKTEVQNGHRDIAEAIKHIPAPKKMKYKAALDYVQLNYPNMSPVAASERFASRVINVGDDLQLLKSPLAGTTDCLIFGHAGYIPDDPRFMGTFEIPHGLTLNFYTIHGQSNRTDPIKNLGGKPDGAMFFNIEQTDIGMRGPVGAEKRGPLMHKPEITRRDRKGNEIEKVTGASQLKFKPLDIGSGAGGQKLVRPNQAGLRPAKTRTDKLLHMLTDRALDGMTFAGGAKCYDYVVKNGLGMHWVSDSADGPWKTDDILAKQDSLLVKRSAVAPGAGQPLALSKAWVPHYIYVKSDEVCRLRDIITQVQVYGAAHLDHQIKDFYFAGCRGIHPGWRPKTED